MEILSNAEYVNTVIPIQAKIFNRNGVTFKDRTDIYGNIFSNDSYPKMVAHPDFMNDENADELFWNGLTRAIVETNPEPFYLFSFLEDVCFKLEPQEFRDYQLGKIDLSFLDEAMTYYCMFSSKAEWGFVSYYAMYIGVIGGNRSLMSRLRKLIPNIHQDVFRNIHIITANVYDALLRKYEIDCEDEWNSEQFNKVYDELLECIWGDLLEYLSYLYGGETAKKILQISLDIGLSDFSIKKKCGDIYEFFDLVDHLIAGIDDSYLNWD